MELSRKRVGFRGGAAGVLGAVLIACTACCFPFLAPVFAWLAVAGLAFVRPYGLIAAALGAGIIALMMFQRRRRHVQCQKVVSIAASACKAGCRTDAKAVEGGAVVPVAAPIACTLSATDFKERARWLNELTARALINHNVDGHRAHLTYRLDAADDVEKMVRQEQECCGFLHFALKRTAIGIEVTVTAPQDAAADAQVLFGHLVPS